MRLISVTVFVLLQLIEALGEDSIFSNFSGEEEEEEERKEDGERWVVLVAGSEGWYSYGDQANVCHAYQIMHANGIPDDHIVVMMYDDIAYNPKNPSPGVIINEPKGENVYLGVPKDYTGKDVRSEVFLKALTGDAQGLHGIGSGKVVESGPNDCIFLYMTDHGFSGSFSFPSDIITARTLRDAIVEMHNNNRYKEILIYMDSNGSGYMFEDIYPDNIGFYGTSSSNSMDSYYCCYNATMGTSLASEYGLAWMDSTEWSDVNELTIKDQYEIVRVLTHKSTALAFGDKDISLEVVATFFGSGTGNQSSFRRLTENHSGGYKSLIRKNDAALEILKRRLLSTNSPAERASLTREIRSLQKKRDFVKDIMRAINLEVTGNETVTDRLMQDDDRKITNWDCYEEVLDQFHHYCFNLGQNPFVQTLMPTLLNLCENGYRAEATVEALKNVCNFPKIAGIV